MLCLFSENLSATQIFYLTNIWQLLDLGYLNTALSADRCILI